MIMAIETECQTPGAQFHTRVMQEGISVWVEFGREIWLTGEQAALLTANLHNAVELVLALVFKEAEKGNGIKSAHS